MTHRLIGSAWILAFALMPLSLCRAADDIVIADFRKDPMPAGWQVEGYAFGSRTPGPERQQAAKTTPNQRQYETGKLASPEFTIERGFLVMELGGTYHPEKCCVALVVDGRDVRRVSPGEAGNPSPPSMDVRELLGRKARLEVRDDHFNGWLELGRVYQAGQPRHAARAEIPAWEPAVFEAKIDAAFLLVPLDADTAPLQTVTIEIDGHQKLAADMPIYFGPLQSKKLDLRVEGGPITLERLHVHQLQSIWR
jgi:hypothetical protein